jgi:hypothetical protein
MTIENDLKPLMDLAKESKESEREIFRLTSGYELRFHEVDINRVVSKEVTGSVIWNIDRWLKSYKEKILPNLSHIEKESLKYKELSEYIGDLEYKRGALIPENKSIEGESHIKQNYSLLKSNKVLTHNQALFTLLGLNAIELDWSLSELQDFNSTRPIGKNKILEHILWDTPQNFELKSCAYFDNGLITSENLIKFATQDNNFFSNNWRKNKFFEYTKDVVSERPENTRQLTEDKKILVNELDIECKSKNKNWSKEARASWIAQQMKERPEIDSKLELTEENIYRNYLKSNKQ